VAGYVALGNVPECIVGYVDVCQLLNYILYGGRPKRRPQYLYTVQSDSVITVIIAADKYRGKRLGGKLLIDHTHVI